MGNNSLKLTSVTAEDADDYYCVILPQDVKQHTTLKVGARLSILCDDRDVTDRSQTFKQGDHHKLICQTFLPTKTDIKWSFNVCAHPMIHGLSQLSSCSSLISLFVLFTGPEIAHIR